MQSTEEVVGKEANGSAVPSIPEASDAQLNGNADTHGLAELLHACRRCGSATFRPAWPATASASWAKSPTPSMRSSGTNQRMAKQLERVGQVVGREGRTRQRVRVGLSDGAWGEMKSSVNSLIDDLCGRPRK